MVSKELLDKIKKEVLIEHDKIRKNPKSYVKILEENLKHFKDGGNVFKKPGQKVGIVTEEGPNAVNECIQYLKKASSIDGITNSEELSKAAQDHANDIGPKGQTGHIHHSPNLVYQFLSSFFAA